MDLNYLAFELFYFLPYLMKVFSRMNNITTFLIGNEWYVVWWWSTHVMMTYSTIVHVLLCHVIISASNNSLDGSKLSDRLKEINDGTGVTYMQVLLSWFTNSVLFVEVTGVPGENHKSPYTVHQYTSPWVGFELTTVHFIL